MSKEREQQALFLIESGISAKEIANQLGYASTTSVYGLAKKYGVKIWDKDRSSKHEQMIKYKTEGHTNAEVADKFNVSLGTATRVCKGIAPQYRGGDPDALNKSREKQRNSTDKLIATVESKLGEKSLEYYGGYTGSNGVADLRCSKCGEVFTRSWVAIRHGSVSCPNGCFTEVIQKRREQRKKVTNAKRNLEEQRKRAAQEQKRKEKNNLAKLNNLLKTLERLHRCPVCGKLTDRRKYCSCSCAKKANNASHEANRRVKISRQMVDKDITLKKLFLRDNGICHICGGQCDYGDCSAKSGFFITGEKYPSIDHIIPLAKGGEHSWNNVALAHFSCNVRKGASTSA